MPSFDQEILLGASDNTLNEPVDRGHQLIREHLAFGDLDGSVLSLDRPCEDTILPASISSLACITASWTPA